MLENSVVFVSKNSKLLSASMYYYYIVLYKFHNYYSITFYSLLKPFKWPHPIIINLPENLIAILDSPIPILIGTYKIIHICIYILGIN